MRQRTTTRIRWHRHAPSVMIGWLAMTAWPLGLPAQPLPAPPASAYRVIESGNYPDDRAAQAKWDPQDKSDPVVMAEIGGRRVLSMPCRFKDRPGQRLSWDSSLAMDLGQAAGVQFKFYCPDASPVSDFMFYLHSGNGWYAAKFEHTNPSGWTVVRIEKTDTTVEGQVAGWKRIDEIRISAWRGSDINTIFYLADIGPVETEAPTVLLRAESVLVARKSPDSASVASAATLLGNHLQTLGVRHTTVSDLDVGEATLRGAKLLILPFNPEMPDHAVKALTAFQKNGGKTISFYQLPESIRSLTGFKFGKHVPQTYPGGFASIRPAAGSRVAGLPPLARQMSWNILQARPIDGRSSVAAWWHSDSGGTTGEPAIVVSGNWAHMTHVIISDDPSAKQALLLAMIGHFVPEAWREAAESAIRDIGRFGPYRDTAQAERGLLEKSPAGAVPAMIQRATDWRLDAQLLMRKGDRPGAVQSAGQARRELVRAYSAAQKPQAGEFRGAWVHNAFGVEGMNWDQAIRILADNGFTAVLPNMAWGGTAYYQSQVLPVSGHVSTRGDQLALCVAACRKHAVECHVWKVCWNLSDRAPESFVEQMKKEERLQAGFNGRMQIGWLCPTHPANQKLEVDSLVEIVSRYDVDGVHLDYIRYPGSDNCFCDGCRRRFETATKVRIANWPQDLRKDGALSQKWLQFRRDNITRVVAGMSARVRKAKPRVRISAAVFTNWPTDRDSVGQDWKLWCQKRYLDFVCPMDYTANNLRFEQMVRRQREWASPVPCYPGIGISTWPDRGDPVRFMDQISITRRIDTGGFVMFQYRESEAREVLPVCGLGITRK